MLGTEPPTKTTIGAYANYNAEITPKWFFRIKNMLENRRRAGFRDASGGHTVVYEGIVVDNDGCLITCRLTITRSRYNIVNYKMHNVPLYYSMPLF